MYLKHRLTFLVLATFFFAMGMHIVEAPARGVMFLLFESELREARIVFSHPGLKGQEGRPIRYEYAHGGATLRSQWHYPDQETHTGKSGRDPTLAYIDALDRNRVMVSVLKRFPNVSCLVREFRYGKMLGNGIVGIGLLMLGLVALGATFLRPSFFK